MERGVIDLHCRHIVHPDVFTILGANALPPSTIKPSAILKRTVVEDAPDELIVVGNVYDCWLVVLLSSVLLRRDDDLWFVEGRYVDKRTLEEAIVADKQVPHSLG